MDMKQATWINEVVCNATDNGEEQMALHEGVMMGQFLLTYDDMETDVHIAQRKLKEIVSWYQNNKARNEAALSQVYNQVFNVELMKG
jgi:hypothetical protein